MRADMNLTVQIGLLYVAFPNPVNITRGLKPLVQQAKIYLIRSGIATKKGNDYCSVPNLLFTGTKPLK